MNIQEANTDNAGHNDLQQRTDAGRTSHRVRYLTRLEQLESLSEEQRQALQPVADKFAFRANDYYLSLIDWNDPDDPIRTVIVPDVQELDQWGRLDPSDEQSYVVMPGVEHKYKSTVLFLVSNVCDGICRYCFRKRVFLGPQKDYLRDVPAAIDYVRNQPEVTNVLLTGGDPLVLTTSKLENIIRQIRQIDHVQIIRIGTKVPAFNPYRILDDPSLLELIGRYSTARKKIYVMTHFVHPRELTDPAVKAVQMLQKAGAIVANQTPLVRGLNDDPHVLGELLGKLSYIGAVPYYIFQCRPALGNKAYTVPVETGYEIVEQAKSLVSGLGKRARYVMSHTSGKVEVVGRSEGYVYFKYHRAADEADSGRFMVFKSNPQAYWLDDYEEMIASYPVDQAYRAYGPQ